MASILPPDVANDSRIAGSSGIAKEVVVKRVLDAFDSGRVGINAPDENRGYTALHYAVQSGFKVRLCLKTLFN